MIATLKSQQHDFNNQLQVIKVLAQLNKNDEIIKYINEYSGVREFSSLYNFQIKNPIISAMFFSQFHLSVAKITHILSNIIQNAIEPFEGLQLSEASIYLTMWEAIEHYHFLIWNNGPVIPE